MFVFSSSPSGMAFIEQFIFSELSDPQLAPPVYLDGPFYRKYGQLLFCLVSDKFNGKIVAALVAQNQFPRPWINCNKDIIKVSASHVNTESRRKNRKSTKRRDRANRRVKSSKESNGGGRGGHQGGCACGCGSLLGMCGWLLYLSSSGSNVWQPVSILTGI